MIAGATARRNVERVDAILEFVRRGLIEAIPAAWSVMEAEVVFARCHHRWCEIEGVPGFHSQIELDRLGDNEVLDIGGRSARDSGSCPNSIRERRILNRSPLGQQSVDVGHDPLRVDDDVADRIRRANAKRPSKYRRRTLIETLDDPDELVRLQAVRALLGIGVPIEVTAAALIKLLDDADDFIRGLAVDYLSLTGPVSEQIRQARRRESGIVPSHW